MQDDGEEDTYEGKKSDLHISEELLLHGIENVPSIDPVLIDEQELSNTEIVHPSQPDIQKVGKKEKVPFLVGDEDDAEEEDEEEEKRDDAEQEDEEEKREEKASNNKKEEKSDSTYDRSRIDSPNFLDSVSEGIDNDMMNSLDVVEPNMSIPEQFTAEEEDAFVLPPPITFVHSPDPPPSPPLAVSPLQVAISSRPAPRPANSKDKKQQTSGPRPAPESMRNKNKHKQQSAMTRPMLSSLPPPPPPPPAPHSAVNSQSGKHRPTTAAAAANQAPKIASSVVKSKKLFADKIDKKSAGYLTDEEIRTVSRLFTNALGRSKDVHSIGKKGFWNIRIGPSTIPGAGKGVLAVEDILPNVILGCYTGKIREAKATIETEKKANRFSDYLHEVYAIPENLRTLELDIEETNGEWHFRGIENSLRRVTKAEPVKAEAKTKELVVAYLVDGSDPKTSSWISRINENEDVSKYNVQFFQRYGRVWARSIKHINKGEELFVSYGTDRYKFISTKNRRGGAVNDMLFLTVYFTPDANTALQSHVHQTLMSEFNAFLDAFDGCWHVHYLVQTRHYTAISSFLNTLAFVGIQNKCTLRYVFSQS